MDNLTQAINEYAMDTENSEKNFKLALIYDDMGQTASAITYYMRAAELTDDKLLAYECLLKQAICFLRQGNRNHTVSVLYKHAICLFPKRPEAHYLLSSLYANDYSFVDSYVGINNALYFLDEGHPPLRTNVGYPGKWGLLLVKSIVAWLWGKGNEARETLLELWNNHRNEMDENGINILKERFKVSKLQIPEEEVTEIQNSIRNEIHQRYIKLCEQDENISYVFELSKECQSITQFGIRDGDNSVTLMLADKKYRAYDNNIKQSATELFSLAKAARYNATAIQADHLSGKIEDTDLLFIDTQHQYDQMKAELESHANSVKKYIVIYGTSKYGIIGESVDGTLHRGIMPAIYEFLSDNLNWNIKEYKTSNCGLTVIEKIY